MFKSLLAAALLGSAIPQIATAQAWKISTSAPASASGVNRYLIISVQDENGLPEKGLTRGSFEVYTYSCNLVGANCTFVLDKGVNTPNFNMIDGVYMVGYQDGASATGGGPTQFTFIRVNSISVTPGQFPNGPKITFTQHAQILFR